MRKITVTLFLTLLLINIAAFIIVKAYEPLRFFSFTALAAYTFLILFISSGPKIKDAYKIWLWLFLPAILAIKIIFAGFSPSYVQNNYVLLLILTLCIGEFLLYLLMRYASRHA